jgi:hypothetical protein
MRRWRIPDGWQIASVSQEKDLIATCSVVKTAGGHALKFEIWNAETFRSLGTLDTTYPIHPAARRGFTTQIGDERGMFFVAYQEAGGLPSPWTIEMWDIWSLRKVHVAKTPAFDKLTFSPDGRILCLHEAGRPAEIWNTAQGRCVSVLDYRRSPFSVRYLEPTSEVVLLDRDAGLTIAGLDGGAISWQPIPVLSKKQRFSIGIDIAASRDGSTVVWAKGRRAPSLVGMPVEERDLVVLNVRTQDERPILATERKNSVFVFFCLGFVLWCTVWRVVCARNNTKTECILGRHIESEQKAQDSLAADRSDRGDRERCAMLAISGIAATAWGVWLAFAVLPLVFLWLPMLAALSGVFGMISNPTWREAKVCRTAKYQIANILIGNVVSAVLGLAVVISLRKKKWRESSRPSESWQTTF